MMSEQTNIFSPSLSPFSVNLVEDIDEINSKHERILLKFNEMFTYINDDTDNTSITSSINFEDFESEVEEQEICNERDEIIDNLEQLKFTPCVIIDFVKGQLQRFDKDAIKEVDSVLSKLGVCNSHFQFDNKYLHKLQSKTIKNINEGIIQWRRYISLPCIGQYSYKALQPYPTLCSRAFEDIKRPRCVCCLCYENLGGHIHHHSGIRGKSAMTCITEKLHVDDITKSLKFIGNLLIKIAQTGNNEIKKNILIKTFEVLLPLASMKSDEIFTDSTTTISTTNISIDHEKQENKNPPMCHVTSHTDRHERKLAKIRMETSNPVERLIKRNNIWNIAIIDNIDFKEKSFKFGNIYDVTRGSSHATLRMAFQVQLPTEVETGSEHIIELTAETPLFGMNQSIDNTLTMFQQIIYELLDFKKINKEFIYKTNFSAETIKRVILTKLNYGCSDPSPNVVILEPGSNPNSDEEILHVAEIYKEDFAMSSHSFLNIVADKAIFHRLIKCREKWLYIRHLLGQWHTSKDFCSVLLVLFSSYGLWSLASRLGVHFLDKFESAVDYRSTARVLDLIWVAVGIAINIYITKKEILFSEIMDSENVYLRV
ncbi:hypothetical protein GLOIN_2v1482460 [Rhizophagus clarus]|uniref:Uncharacterized protein n=1 Tax=Rhizophagus clarus TaxID=94130 RepID=A0A8H3M1S5_9GLOM|nr:hypothetical protein GLOIN_2v1482460 [Rhizophagus clarus]